MAEHENCIGETSEWYTPPDIFDALRLKFDLDPCSPGEWSGCVFMNPPFGGRLGHVPWLTKFFDHGDGIAIVRAYTSSNWWHEHMHRAEMIVFPKGKTKFVRPDGSIGGSPGHGIVLIGMGELGCASLATSGLGMIWDRRK